LWRGGSVGSVARPGGETKTERKKKKEGGRKNLQKKLIRKVGAKRHRETAINAGTISATKKELGESYRRIKKGTRRRKIGLPRLGCAARRKRTIVGTSKSVQKKGRKRSEKRKKVTFF